MKLLRINIIKSGYDRAVLDGFDEFFEPFAEDNQKANPICLVGKNGTGKSQLLEVLARIFFYLDKKYRSFEANPKLTSKIEFELEYFIRDGQIDRRIKIVNKQFGKKVETKVYEVAEETEIEIKYKDIEAVLPNHIIGYSSGENETLSLPFLDTNYEYGDYVKSLGLNPSSVNYDYVPTTRLIFPDYSSNFAVLISNYLLKDKLELNIFKEDELIQLEKLYSFRIVIQQKHKAAPGKNGVQPTPELVNAIEKLKLCATCYETDDKTRSYTLDYFVNDGTRAAFKYHFKMPIKS